MTGLTIACAVDLSDCSRRAIRYAGALADHFGARVVVVNVCQPGVDRVAHDDRYADAERRHALVDFVSSEIDFVTWRGRSVEFALLKGEPGHEIIDFVRSGDTDLLVMGTRGRTGVQTAFLGSTTAHALRRSPIPVLAVPLTEAGITARLLRPGPVVVPIDFSATSTAAAHIVVVYGVMCLARVPVLAVPSAAWRAFSHRSPTGDAQEKRDPIESGNVPG